MIDGEKTWNTGIHTASHDMIMARTSGKAGDGHGITAFLVPINAPGFKIEEYLWTFNMPTDHAHVTLKGVRVPDSAVFGGEGRGLQVVQHFFNENRIRQAASSLGAASSASTKPSLTPMCARRSARRWRATRRIQFPLVELQTQCEMLRALIHKTAWHMDTVGNFAVSDKVSMCNYWANRLCCEAADRAMQVHGGLGYSRHKPFEHIYRHHRRYRITEGSEEIQMRRVAGYMFGFMEQRAPKGVAGMIDYGRSLKRRSSGCPGFEDLLACERLSAGASRETYKLTVRINGAERKLALRRAQSDGRVRHGRGAGARCRSEAVRRRTAGRRAGAGSAAGTAAGGRAWRRVRHGVDRRRDAGRKIARAPEFARRAPDACAPVRRDPRAAPRDGRQRERARRRSLDTFTPEHSVRKTHAAYLELESPQPMIDFTAQWLLENLPKHAAVDGWCIPTSGMAI